MLTDPLPTAADLIRRKGQQSDTSDGTPSSSSVGDSDDYQSGPPAFDTEGGDNDEAWPSLNSAAAVFSSKRPSTSSSTGGGDRDGEERRRSSSGGGRLEVVGSENFGEKAEKREVGELASPVLSVGLSSPSFSEPSSPTSTRAPPFDAMSARGTVAERAERAAGEKKKKDGKKQGKKRAALKKWIQTDLIESKPRQTTQVSILNQTSNPLKHHLY
jgi:hypothetical protein